ARHRFVLSRGRTLGTTVPAIEDVRGQIGTIAATASFAVSLAIVATSPAVRVRLQVAADPLAGRDRATSVAATGSADAARVAVALLTSRQALRLLRLVAALAELGTRIGPLRPRRFRPQRTEDRAGNDGPQPSQRFTAR